jgi:hypothetical protein
VREVESEASEEIEESRKVRKMRKARKAAMDTQQSGTIRKVRVKTRIDNRIRTTPNVRNGFKEGQDVVSSVEVRSEESVLVEHNDLCSLCCCILYILFLSWDGRGGERGG